MFVYFIYTVWGNKGVKIYCRLHFSDRFFPFTYRSLKQGYRSSKQGYCRGFKITSSSYNGEKRVKPYNLRRMWLVSNHHNDFFFRRRSLTGSLFCFQGIPPVQDIFCDLSFFINLSKAIVSLQKVPLCAATGLAFSFLLRTARSPEPMYPPILPFIYAL